MAGFRNGMTDVLLTVIGLRDDKSVSEYTKEVIDRMQACGRGIAVANALEAVKEAADEVCDSNNKDGLAKWLEKFLTTS